LKMDMKGIALPILSLRDLAACLFLIKTLSPRESEAEY